MSTAVATRPTIASCLKPAAELALMYADGLVKGISEETFAHMPSKDGPHTVNSPAFNIGHLAIYPDVRILAVLGREDLVKPLPFSADLFKAGAPCVDEPGKYPSKDVLVSTFVNRYRAVIDILPSVPEEVFARQNPVEGRAREMFPTIGALATFLLVGHTQSHLGQISVWRRIMGLGSVM